MKIKSLTLMLLMLAVSIIFIAGCSSKSESDVIKIGYFGPLTGPVAYTGEPVKNAITLAHNQKNIVDGKRIEIIYEDDKCDTKEAVTIANKLITEDKVDILISGVCSGSTLGVAPIAESEKIILISPVAASPKITEAGEYIFRVASSSTLMAKDTASIVERLGYKSIGILFENNDYPVGWKEAFKKEYSGEIRVEEGFNPGDMDMRTQLLKIKSVNVDAILFVVLSPVSADLLIKQKHELGIDKQIIGNEVFSFKSVIGKNKDAAQGILVVTYKYDLNSDKMKRFLQEYKEYFSKEITEEIYGALGFDTYAVIYEALSRCKDLDSGCLKDELTNLNQIDGVSGNFDIDWNGDGIHEFVLRRVVDGKIVEI